MGIAGFDTPFDNHLRYLRSLVSSNSSRTYLQRLFWLCNNFQWKIITQGLRLLRFQTAALMKALASFLLPRIIQTPLEFLLWCYNNPHIFFPKNERVIFNSFMSFEKWLKTRDQKKKTNIFHIIIKCKFISVFSRHYLTWFFCQVGKFIILRLYKMQIWLQVLLDWIDHLI